jgi:hypothetical protein
MAILASVVLVQPLAYLAFVVLVEELVAYLVVDLVVAFNHVACFASGSVVFLDGILGLVHLWFNDLVTHPHMTQILQQLLEIM